MRTARTPCASNSDRSPDGVRRDPAFRGAAHPRRRRHKDWATMTGVNRRTANEVLEAMVAMFASGDPSAAAEIVAPDYLDHQGLGSGPVRGIEGFAHVVRTNHTAHERQEISVEDLFGAEDRAVARIRWRGRRHNGMETDRETIDIIRVSDGRAVEHWGART